MRTLYFQCNMGAAGDMLMAALLELLDEDGRIDFIREINSIGLDGVEILSAPSDKCGVRGTHVIVKIYGEEEESHDHHDHHSHHTHHGHEHSHGHSHNHKNHDFGYSDIGGIIGRLRVSEKVKKDALGIYSIIAEAESHVHGVPVTEIHFHELGMMDAVADITGICMLMERLAPDSVIASPVHVGYGNVRCSHGILPVPAPATACILKGVPIYGGDIQGELCTPTGAAILKHFADKFAAMPVMAVEKIGYGMGSKDFPAANCVRAFIGEANDETGCVRELICNIDDMTPESIAFAQQILLGEGALDVYTVPIGMKKSRTGILLTCMCRDEGDHAAKIARLIFRHTTTIGIREVVSRRYTLNREEHMVQTKYGGVRVKTSSGYGVSRSKPEYEDIALIAKENNISLSEVAGEVYKQTTH